MALSHRLAGFAWLSPSPNLAQGLGNNLKSKCLSLLFPTGSTVVCDYVLDTRQYVTSAPCALLPRQAATRVCVCVCVCVCCIIPLYCWPKAVQVVCRLSDLSLNVLMSVGVCVRVNVVNSVQHPPV